MIRAWLQSVGLGLAVAACAGTPSRTPQTDVVVPQTFVVVVRHAEKAPTPVNDPELSAAGTSRAAALNRTLADQPVHDVVVSHLQRTRLTAADFITRTSPVVHVVPIGAAGTAAHIQAVADTVRAIARRRGRGGILVVGHSNTVTQIVSALGVPEPAPLCDSQYSQLFRVTLGANGASSDGASLTRSAYGATDAPDATCQQSLPGMLGRP
jgi:phosphohistidine phosphatase SixA